MHALSLISEKNCLSHSEFILPGISHQVSAQEDIRRMAENGFAPPPPREFRRHILSCRELKVASFKRCLHSVLRGVSLFEPVTYVTL